MLLERLLVVVITIIDDFAVSWEKLLDSIHSCLNVQQELSFSSPVLCCIITVFLLLSHTLQGWLRAIFDESSENIPSLSAVCDEFMDGLLRMKKPAAKTAKPSAAVTNVVHSVTPVAAVETHTPMLVDDDLPMNFGMLCV